MNGARLFAAGFFAPFEGARLIASRSHLRRTARALFLSAAVIYTGGLILAWPWIARAVGVLAETSLELFDLTRATTGGEIVWVILACLLWPTLLALLICALFLVSQIIAAPLYARLATQALKEFGVEGVRSGWLRSAIDGGITTFLKALVFLALATVLVILSFFPGLGLLASFGFLLCAAFDTVDVSFDVLGMSFASRWRFFLAAFPAFCGLALAIGLVFLVPGLNFFLFPASVVGASRLVLVVRRQT